LVLTWFGEDIGFLLQLLAKDFTLPTLLSQASSCSDENNHDLITMRSGNCTSSYPRMVVYLGIMLAERMIQQGDLVMGEEELQMVP
jgi:hypothetical protein